VNALTTTAAAPEVRIDVLGDEGDGEALAATVRRGLSQAPKHLPPKLLYDARGSELFDRITELPEYYPARCERAILNRHAPEIVAATGAEELLELGSGVASKTRALLYAMAGAGTLRRYLALDVDPSVVERSAAELTALYPGLAVHGLVGDFEQHLERVPASRGRRLVAFLGGTIGNLAPAGRDALLRRLRGVLHPDDCLVLGADLVKDESVLLAAYDDPEGVTRAFTANVLRVLNRELGADADLGAFEPFARWNPEAEWMELGLRARSPQRVRLAALGGLEVRFAEGEEVRTEISAKFTRERLERELAEAGLSTKRFLVDEERFFSVTVAAARGERQGPRVDHSLSG
jgi:dimethylhistidine N-methyltransferase